MNREEKMGRQKSGVTPEQIRRVDTRVQREIFIKTMPTDRLREFQGRLSACFSCAKSFTGILRLGGFLRRVKDELNFRGIK